MGKSVNPWYSFGLDALGGVSEGIAQHEANQLAKANLQWQKEQFGEQMKFAKEQSNLQWAREKEMFGMENQYNSPVEQVARLRSAGLNPNLMLGQGTMATASGGSAVAAAPPALPALSNSAGSMPNFATGLLDGLSKGAQALQQLNAAEKSGVDTEVYKALKDELIQQGYEQTKALRLANHLAGIQVAVDTEVKMKSAKEQLNNLIEQTKNLILHGQVEVAEAHLKNAMGNKVLKENELLEKQFDDLINLLHEQVETQKATTKKTEEEAKAIPQRVQAEFMQARASVISANAQDFLAHHPNDFGAALVRLVENVVGTPEEIGEFIKGGKLIDNVKFVVDKLKDPQAAYNQFVYGVADAYDLSPSVVKAAISVGTFLHNPARLVNEILLLRSKRPDKK